ncbi:MAG: SprB repeat-containing protein, partial [Saprospiraceae bacterium]|nr:SprB repeat-containing protein [Candidatus Opimibacter iunctus]
IAEPPQMLANAGSTDETGPDTNDGTAWAAPTGGTPPYTYLWSNNSTDSLITNLVPGFYSVTVRDAHMCAVIASVEIDSFGCSLSGLVTNSSCFQSCDGSIEVTPVNATEPFTYLWSNGSTTPALNGLCAGGI